MAASQPDVSGYPFAQESISDVSVFKASKTNLELLEVRLNQLQVTLHRLIIVNLLNIRTCILSNVRQHKLLLTQSTRINFLLHTSLVLF